MKNASKFGYKKGFISPFLIVCAPHVIFFWLRILIFGWIKFILDPKMHHKYQVAILATDFFYMIQLITFQLYLTAAALIHSNLIGYKLSMFLILHNSLISLYILECSEIVAIFSIHITTVSICVISLIEASYMAHIISIKRYNFGFKLFKKIGPDEVIKDAYSARKALEAFAGINFFILVLIFGNVLYNSLDLFSGRAYIIIPYLLIIFFQQITIYTDFNGENLFQRKIALILSAIRIAFSVCGVINEFFYKKGGSPLRSEIDLCLYLDSSILSCLQCYFLWLDRIRFGSGLKEHLISRPKVGLEDH